MDRKIKWGILSAADIAAEHAIPAMLSSKYSSVQAIASRSYDKAKKLADRYDISKCYGSYEELLEDPDIEAIYIPLPNHLHVPWSIKCLKAGKHVLVEKPIALTVEEAKELLEESLKYPHLKIMEAFMYRFHPQWIKIKELVDSGAIGKLTAVKSSFSYFDDNPNSIVNIKEYGGGSLMDIGCYPISISRLLFNSEPKCVTSIIDYHPKFNVDVLTSGIMEFDEGISIFFSSTQLFDDQNVSIMGTKGSLEIEIPFNPPIDKPTKIILNKDEKKETIEIDICDQYSIQADQFSLSIIEDKKVPTPLQDAVNNMIVIEKLVKSNKEGKKIYL